MALNRLSLVALAATLVALPIAHAQPAKQRIDKAADLPRFEYRIDGKVDGLLADPAKFSTFAAAVRRDTQSVLDRYEIADRATERQLLATLMQVDWIEGRHDAAMATLARIRALEEKPADKLTSGMMLRAVDGARRATGAASGDAYRAEVAKRLGGELGTLPYAVVENNVKGAKTSAEIVSEALVLGQVRDVIQPIVDRTGSLSSDFAPAIVAARYRLAVQLPLKATLVDVYSRYLAANRVDKPDIWAARDASLPPGRDYQPVAVAIWDSGVDTALFRDRLVRDASGAPALIAFDRYSDPAQGELYPVPAALKDKLPRMKARLKGFSDLQANVDSAEATEVKQYLSNLRADEYRAAIEELGAAGNYIHGTHVAGIAAAGNPYVRLATARIEFTHTLQPDPCPTLELARKDARNTQAYVDFFRRSGVRVVNMSFGGNVADVEGQLEQCGIGKTPDERKAIAREWFDIGKVAFVEAMASAPGILFVAAAGNANADSSFAEAVPADIVLPNLVTVGAVDKAGDEAPFTSYGKTVVVHANGYLVESTIPGGERIPESGTSMSAPQVTNLAAKILAVNPSLAPPQVIAIIRDTAETTADGRRVLIHPQKAVAAAAAMRG
ncbi:MAG: S8 family serine peptidase [Betaproteobacteria bacterium]